MTKNSKKVISISNLDKSFSVGKGTVDVLKNINLDIESGEFVVLYGPSGCGKSTLLNTIVGLEVPTKGKVVVRGTDVYSLDSDGRAQFRRKKFGMVHQSSNWIKPLNVLENVAFPLLVAGNSEKASLKRANRLLKLFKLEDFAKNVPTELSGGQQQRVSVVRSLITNPWIIITDEPTGNLDSTSGNDLMYVLKYLNEESKRTIIMVTHNENYKEYGTKLVKMEDGKIISVKTNKKVSVNDEAISEDIVPEEVDL